MKTTREANDTLEQALFEVTSSRLKDRRDATKRMLRACEQELARLDALERIWAMRVVDEYWGQLKSAASLDASTLKGAIAVVCGALSEVVVAGTPQFKIQGHDIEYVQRKIRQGIGTRKLTAYLALRAGILGASATSTPTEAQVTQFLGRLKKTSTPYGTER